VDKRGRAAKKGYHFENGDEKVVSYFADGVSFFQEKGTTLSVAAPGDTNPSDAIEHSRGVQPRLISS